jgi:hypothetical protein
LRELRNTSRAERRIIEAQEAEQHDQEEARRRGP